MKKRVPSHSCHMALALIAVSFLGAARAATLLYDGMDYADSTQLNLSWVGLGNSPVLRTQTSYGPSPLAALADTPAAGKFMGLANGFAYRNLSESIQNDWVLSVKILHETYARGVSVFLLNNAGTQGYGLHWNSAWKQGSAGKRRLKPAESRE